MPYLALWTRLAPFDPNEVSALMRERRVVRAALMRTTVHLVTADDALTLRPLLHPVLARTFKSTSWGQALKGEDVDAIVAAGRALITEQPRSRAELRPLLHERWPGLDPDGMAQAVAYLTPTVQATPRGVWGESGQAVLASLEEWLGRELDPEPSIDQVVVGYLRAFGPATVQDVQAWCGLTKLREVTDRLGGSLRRFRSDAGAELLDVPDGLLPDPDMPAPVRFLPEYDNALLGYADRSRFAADGEFTWLQGGPGGYVGTVLVDGLGSATWAIRRSDGTARLEVRPGLKLTKTQRDDVQAEGLALMRFVAPDDRHEMEWADPDSGA